MSNENNKRYVPSESKNNISEDKIGKRYIPTNEENLENKRYVPSESKNNISKDKIGKRYIPTNEENLEDKRYIPTESNDEPISKTIEEKKNTDNDISISKKNDDNKNPIIKKEHIVKKEKVSKNNKTKWKTIGISVVAVLLAFFLLNNIKKETDTSHTEVESDNKTESNENVESNQNKENKEDVEVLNAINEEHIEIEENLVKSITDFTHAVNSGDPYIALNNYTYMGPLYEEQEWCIDYFYEKGIKEELEDIVIKNIEKIDDETYKIYANVKINIYKDNEWKLRGFKNIYSMKKVDGKYLMHEIIEENPVSLDELN